MKPQTSHETEADKILKEIKEGGDGESTYSSNFLANSVNKYRAKSLVQINLINLNDNAQKLLTAYKDELEFLDNLMKRKTMSEGTLQILGERIQHLESEIKRLDQVGQFCGTEGVVK